jgi:GTPase SAR1 family protein
MVTSQWLLRRVAESEQHIYAYIAFGEERFRMLGYVAKQRAQLERSFRTAIEDMKQSQKERQAKPQPQPVQPVKNAPAQPPVPRPDYVMSEGAEAHPVFCSPETPDTR